MARKGNRNKGFSGSEPELPTVDCAEESITGKMSGTSVGDRASKTHHLMNDKKSKKKSRNPPEKVNQEMDATRTEDPQISCNKAAANYNKAAVEDVKYMRGYSPKNANNYHGQPLNGSHWDGVAETLEFSSAMFVEFLRTTRLSISKAYCKSLERLAPLFSSLASMLRDSSDFARGKILIASPIVFRWFMQLGKIVLLLFVLWLDCALRGCESILLMGTALFFSIIWCSSFSMVAMIGILKFLLFVAAAVMIGHFIGFTVGFFMISISGVGLLWFYGSFWTTSLVVFLGGLSFLLKREQLALLLFSLYSVYSAWFYLGWLSVIVALNLAFISNDIFAYYARNMDDTRSPPEQTDGMRSQPGLFSGEHVHASSAEQDYGLAADRSPGMPSTSGLESGMTSEEEVARLLNCSDHYSVLGLSRFENVDVSTLKREYRKKAMLVHPDKNMGNEKAAEAFMKLQNAYEVLLDAFKRKAYDSELKSEELLNYIRRFNNTSGKKGRNGLFTSVDTGDGEMHEESRRIACRKCGNFHIWVYTNKSKSKARWCQECKDHHPAKDGDGWVEQSSQPFLFGVLQRVMAPAAFVCADSKIYNATEWYMCQGMRCPVNTHKSSFHVNTSVTMKQNNGKGFNSGQRSGAPNPFVETMTDEEFVAWVHNTVQTGIFENFPGSSSDSPATNGGDTPKSGGNANNKKKKKGKKQW
ncbi:hypothetical protein Leryth_023343 [Lithospermum erythrorhizon]|nr:hypothetical protein Leryth_023343 [Lithospermum erythrorhizon]